MKDVYGLKRVINASGRMSILGVSLLSDSVVEAMKTGGQKYVEIADLVDKAGERIAEKIGSESAVVVNSASSGIALSIAAVVTEGNHRKSEKLHQETIAKNEIILFKGHNVQYGAPIETMIRLGGGKPVEVGFANEGKKQHIKEAIDTNTAAIFYVKSHHAVQKNMISIEEAWEVARANNIPLIVDAAAEEDLRKYVHISDLAIYSGSKALEGPTSGIVAGKSELIQSLKIQFNYIGRSMKVGKEMTFGLLQAVDNYFSKESAGVDKQEELQVLEDLNQYKGVRVSIVQDEAGRHIFRARIAIQPAEANKTAKEVTDELKNGDIAIYTRDHGLRQGFFDVDPRPLQGDDMAIIHQRLKAILGEDTK